MIRNPEKQKRKFVPVTIADSLKNINKKFLYKYGKLDYTIHSKWGDIVGNFFINHSEPVKISSIPNSTNENEDGSTVYDRYLHVNVSPAAAIEFQHFQDKIVEKINSYFGYKAIKKIKIHQQFVNKTVSINTKNSPNIIKESLDKKKVLETVSDISNKKLEESIVKLGLSIRKEYQ
tara:strand:- start:478 stop:1005 length:528 start_codon:yes stop_codon:yes gene_type:complete